MIQTLWRRPGLGRRQAEEWAVSIAGFTNARSMGHVEAKNPDGQIDLIVGLGEPAGDRSSDFAGVFRHASGMVDEGSIRGLISPTRAQRIDPTTEDGRWISWGEDDGFLFRYPDNDSDKATEASHGDPAQEPAKQQSRETRAAPVLRVAGPSREALTGTRPSPTPVTRQEGDGARQNASRGVIGWTEVFQPCLSMFSRTRRQCT